MVCQAIVVGLGGNGMVERRSRCRDGWEIAPENLGIESDAIDAADTICMDALAYKYTYHTLFAHRNVVGPSDGPMGNSEVGYVHSVPISS